jgi:hypothetical protein
MAIKKARPKTGAKRKRKPYKIPPVCSAAHLKLAAELQRGTRSDASRRTGIERSKLGQFLNGECALWFWEIWKLCRFLDIPLDYVLDDAQPLKARNPFAAGDDFTHARSRDRLPSSVTCDTVDVKKVGS